MSQFPNDVGVVNLEQVMLYGLSGGEPQDIVHLIQRIDVFESLGNYTLSADIYMSDGIELLNYFPIRGEEFVKFSIQTPDRKTINYDLFVESILSATPNENSMLKYYVLRCVTKDFLKNSHTLFSKRYTDLNYDDAVRQVIFDLGSDKSVNVETTKGKFDYVVNNVRPFQVIDLLKERSVSGEKNLSSLFYFYEDNEKYNFVTIEKLIQDRKGLAQHFQFFYDISNLAVDLEKVINVRNILYYKTVTHGSSIRKIRSGRMANQIRQFDIFHGTYYDKYEYKNTNDYRLFEETDEKVDFNSDAFNSMVASTPGKISMTVKDGTRPEMYHNQNIHYKGPFQEKIDQYGLNIRVYGDTTLMVGDVIDVNMPEISGVTKSAEEQKIYAGNYLVFTLNHSIVRESNDGRFQHYMNLDLRKPNLRRRT